MADNIVGPETSVKRQSCLGCGARVERTAVVGGLIMEVAKVDDFAVCNACGEVMRWAPGMQLRGLTSEEADIARKHPAIRSLSTMMRTKAEHRL